MPEILFLYEGQQIIIEYYNIEDKMEEIIYKFTNMIKEKNNNLCFMYNGYKINEKLKLNEIIDKNEEKINILVYNKKK